PAKGTMSICSGIRTDSCPQPAAFFFTRLWNRRRKDQPEPLSVFRPFIAIIGAWVARPEVLRYSEGRAEAAMTLTPLRAPLTRLCPFPASPAAVNDSHAGLQAAARVGLVSDASGTPFGVPQGVPPVPCFGGSLGRTACFSRHRQSM